jgi:hypothetical protein
MRYRCADPKAAVMYDIFCTGCHSNQAAIPKRGLQKKLRNKATELLKLGVRPSKVEQHLRKEYKSLPANARKKIFNIAKNIKIQNKKYVGKIDTNHKLFQWYRSHLVRLVFPNYLTISGAYHDHTKTTFYTSIYILVGHKRSV